MDNVIVSCENINKKFKSKTVLEDVSFEIKRGEFLSLLGPSGCGKTTILRMLIGIEKPSSGRIMKDGVDITNTAPKDRNIGIVFQNYSLFPNMDVYHNISYALQSKKDKNGQKMSKDVIDKKVREIIETVGLEEHIYKKPKQLAFISLSFTKAFPNDLSFTLEHIVNIFSNTHGVGLAAYIFNSLELALLTSVVGTAFAYLLGYFSVRKSGRMAKAVDLLALSTVAIPGLVLGIGYIFLFKGTNGTFYGTILILIVVNVFHFLGSPYLLAKNCLSKINSDYEVIGETLGINKGRIITHVLLPNSVTTLIEMFSYFFLNSMITISAVAFLCTYDNQPLSILITTYEKNSNYEMQSVISLIVLLLNVVARLIFTMITTVVNRKNNKTVEGGIGLSRMEFDLLTYLEKNGKGLYSQRKLADELTITLSNASRLVRDLAEHDYINVFADGSMEISEKGLKALEPYKVRKAIILAAGFGQRLAPVTLDTPKPLVKVNGVRILDTLLDALYAKGIKNITIVRGYKKEQFDQLLEKYPTIHFIDNPEFNLANNISSLFHAIDLIDRCYICEADLYVSNSDIINKYEYRSNYLGAKVTETDDWCFKKRNGYADGYQMGGTDCYQAFGISYWNGEDSEKLKSDLRKVYGMRGGKENLWEQVPLRIMKKNYKLEIRKCHKSDILEIDNFIELIAADPCYASYPGHEDYQGI